MLDALRPSLAQLVAYETHDPQGADKLDANEFPYDLPSWFQEKLHILSQQEIQSNRYPDAGYHKLKQSIAAYAQVKANQVSIGNGSDELIRSLIIATCLENRGAVLVADPTFSVYRLVAQTLGVPCFDVGRDDDFHLDLDRLEDVLREHTIRVVFLPTPNSPTGTALTPQELEKLLEIGPETLVVLDEAYFEFGDMNLVTRLANHPNLVLMRTFSKAFRLAAYRIGYVLAAPMLIQALEKVRLPYNLPSISELAALLALDNRTELLAALEEIKKERTRVFQHLQQLSGVKVWPSTANFHYFRCLNHSAQQIYQDLWQQGTLIRATGGGLRATIGTPAENNCFLSRLQQALRLP
jgi:histidinol-phosphate aminotransferase